MVLMLSTFSSESPTLEGNWVRIDVEAVWTTYTSSISSLINSADLITFLGAVRPRGRLNTYQSTAPHQIMIFDALRTEYWCWPWRRLQNSSWEALQQDKLDRDVNGQDRNVKQQTAYEGKVKLQEVYAEKVAPFICVQQGRHGRNMTPQDRKKAR